MDGLLIIDKPPAWTSHDVVAAVRKIVGQKKAGHGGTLDPEATGVLPVALGKATRFLPYLAGSEKNYTGSIRLGYSTDTYDASGVQDTPEVRNLPDLERIKEISAKFTGEFFQVPPPYSSKKVNGRRAYRLARAGQKPVLKPVRISVSRFTLTGYDPPFVNFEIICSSGTYVRSLAHDLGRDLGCGGHLASLRRTAVGRFSADSAITIEELEAALLKGSLPKLLIALENILPDAPAVFLSAEAAARIKNGAPVFSVHVIRAKGFDPFAFKNNQDVLRLFDQEERIIALGRYTSEQRMISPFLVLA